MCSTRGRGSARNAATFSVLVPQVSQYVLYRVVAESCPLGTLNFAFQIERQRLKYTIFSPFEHQFPCLRGRETAFIISVVVVKFDGIQNVQNTKDGYRLSCVLW